MDQAERDARLSRMAAERHQTVEEMLAKFFSWMRKEPPLDHQSNRRSVRSYTRMRK